MAHPSVETRSASCVVTDSDALLLTIKSRRRFPSLDGELNGMSTVMAGARSVTYRCRKPRYPMLRNVDAPTDPDAIVILNVVEKSAKRFEASRAPSQPRV